jgi:hypothetical protein
MRDQSLRNSPSFNLDAVYDVIMGNQYCNPMQPPVSDDGRTLDAFSVVARPA